MSRPGARGCEGQGETGQTAERGPAQLALPLADLGLPEEGQLPRALRIYCNRNLRFDQIAMVGFDLDYTLAIYNQREVDRLSVEATARKLVECGYPESLLSMRAPIDMGIRGLLVDKRLGNILKTDRHQYVKRVFHGTRALGAEQRRRLYRGRSVKAGTKRYHSIDSLYALSEVAVFAAAVDELDGQGGKVDYARLFEDIRACIDAAHRDGSIKNRILRNLNRYLVVDPELAPMLHKLRSARKKTFLLTNSDPAYADALMSHLIGNQLPEYPSWKQYFDVIITSAAKPGFFVNQERFRLAAAPGQPASASSTPVAEFQRGRLYQQGCIREFERQTAVHGDRILYVGDNVHADVLRAKKQSAWRTLMIIQEMEAELAALQRCRHDIGRMDQLDRRRYLLLDDLRERRTQLKSVESRIEQTDMEADARVDLQSARLRLRRSIERIRMQSKAVEAEFAQLEGRVDEAFHPFWGSFFKAGSELSSFGEQVERYACLYTARVTNLMQYSTGHYFRAPLYRMAHE